MSSLSPRNSVYYSMYILYIPGHLFSLSVFFCNPILLYLAVTQCILNLQRYQTAQCSTRVHCNSQLHSTHLSHHHDLSTAELQLLTVLQYCLRTLCPHCIVKRLPLLIFSAVLQALHFPIQTTSTLSNTQLKHCRACSDIATSSIYGYTDQCPFCNRTLMTAACSKAAGTCI